jgi:hypothetical protein
MIRIDRSNPSFVAKAVGVLTGKLAPATDGRNAKIITDDGIEIPVSLHDRAIAELTTNPVLFTTRLDFLVWPRTRGMDLVGTVIKLEEAAPRNPDRDLFLIQGMALRNRRFSNTAKIGIRCNTSDKRNRSNFDKFWLNLHGHLREGMVNSIYQITAKRRGSRLFIIQSDPHIKTGKRWELLPQEEPSSSSSTPRQLASNAPRVLPQSSSQPRSIPSNTARFSRP